MTGKPHGYLPFKENVAAHESNNGSSGSEYVLAQIVECHKG